MNTEPIVHNGYTIRYVPKPAEYRFSYGEYKGYHVFRPSDGKKVGQYATIGAAKRATTKFAKEQAEWDARRAADDALLEKWRTEAERFLVEEFAEKGFDMETLYREYPGDVRNWLLSHARRLENVERKRRLATACRHRPERSFLYQGEEDDTYTCRDCGSQMTINITRLGPPDYSGDRRGFQYYAY